MGLYEGHCRPSIAFEGLTNASKSLQDEHKCVKYSTEVNRVTCTSACCLPMSCVGNCLTVNY
jgi:hypothetical protein